MTNAQVATYNPAEGEAMPWRPEPATPMQMIQTAIANGAGIEMIEKLMTLQERFEANQGRKAFDQAIAAAKAAIPPIVKNREVDFTSAKGRTNYRHEDLGQIAKIVDPILGENGLSYRFRTAQDARTVTVTCVISHRDGYSEETTLASAVDESGNKNHLQAVGSAITYLQRYTLKAALGLAATNDDDGSASGKPVDLGAISAEQETALRALMGEAKADEARFLKFYKIGSLSDFPVSRYGEADARLRQKIAQEGNANA